jgi:replicative DNA helicase
MSEAKIKNMFCRPSEERALISYCIKDISNYFSVCSKLLPSDFLYPQHEMLMLIFSSLVSKGSNKFDTNLIIAEATAGGVLENIGGLQYIKTISNMMVSDSNFNIYLNTVFESSTKFKLYCLLLEKLKKIEVKAKDVETELLGLSMRGLNINEPINLSEGLSDYIESMKDSKIELSGLSTGYKILDRQIDGMTPGSVLVVAARKKEGKSALLTNIAMHVAYKQRIPVLYVDTELPFNEWRPRALSIVSGVKERDIKHGGYDSSTYTKLKKCEEIIEKGKLFHEYMPGYSVDKLVALYKKYSYKEHIGLIVFDYLKEPDSSSIERQRKEYQILGDVTTKIKDLAGILNIPALTAVQLNRDDDIADSDRIARYADVICIWKGRDKQEIESGGYGCGTNKLIIRDTRRGGTTTSHGIGYKFHKEFLRIEEVSIDKQYFTNFDKVVNAIGTSDIICESKEADDEQLF